MVKEKTVVNNIFKALKQEVGGFWFKYHGSAYNKAGIPDIIGCVDGHFVAIEVKAPGRKNTVTKIQDETLTQISLKGGTSIISTDPEHAVEAVKKGLYEHQTRDYMDASP